MTDLIAQVYQPALQNYAFGRLLDLGCGTVPLFEAYRPFVTENICVDWIDSIHQTSYLDAEVDLNLGTLPFACAEFDTVICSDVLEHIASPEPLCQEISRVLRPNGKLLLNVPFYYWLHEKPHDFYRYTEFALRRFMDSSGLRVVELISIGGAPEIIADILAKNSLRVPRIGRMAAVAIQWVTWQFIRGGIGKRVSEATRDDFPIGYFLVASKV